MTTLTRPKARLKVCLPTDEKADLEEAARVTGRTISEYVRAVIRQAAQVDLARGVVVIGEVFEQFLMALESDGEPNAALHKAHAHAKELGL